ncbi:MAG: F0F1 ATP synthase subunit B [Planctomycetia bacterium]|nr:F0F1 ATP synthase subunit B [Planctomycetia bacterium]
MKFNLWTILFQVINFVILLYILKRILYKPIREIIEKRRGLIAKTVGDAEKTKKEALELKENNQKELNKAKELQGQMLEQSREEALKDRNKLLDEAHKEAAKINEKEKALIDAEKMRIESELKNKTLEMVSVFASNLLKDISDEELHKAIFRKLVKENGKIVSDISKIKEKEEILNIDLVTAYPLPMDDVKTFKETLESQLAKKIKMNTTVDKTLIAGVRIKAYDMIYDSSLAGQINALASQLKETR